MWTSSTPMFYPRDYHSCVLTEGGEVLIAGGGDGVYIFNPVTLEWCDESVGDSSTPET